jgi:hypothetical protein
VTQSEHAPTSSKSSEELLAAILPEWRRTLPPRLRAMDVDGFLRREAGAIKVVLRSAVTLRRMLDGVAPDTAADFTAYAEIVANERPRDAQPDSVVIKRMARRIDRLLAHGESDAFAVRGQGREYVEARAEALLLRHDHGWDAVALYLKRPAIAVSTTETVIAVRDDMGGLYMHPMWRMTGALNRLACNMFAVEARVQRLHESINGDYRTRADLLRLAPKLWSRARGHAKG